MKPISRQQSVIQNLSQKSLSEYLSQVFLPQPQPLSYSRGSHAHRAPLDARQTGTPFHGTSFDKVGTPFDGTPFEKLGTPFEGAFFKGPTRLCKLSRH